MYLNKHKTEPIRKFFSVKILMNMHFTNILNQKHNASLIFRMFSDKKAIPIYYINHGMFAYLWTLVYRRFKMVIW